MSWEFERDLAWGRVSMYWYRWEGACEPGMWCLAAPEQLVDYGVQRFTPCVVDNFGNLVRVPA